MPAPRVRFAPAPSGWLHVGGARTALFNWLHARGGDGVFVLRIEDTDAQRSSDEALQGVLDALRFLGLTWDEGPDVGGPYGPYVQSQRRPLHDAVAGALLARGDAYEAFETAEELTAEREAAQRESRPPGYSGGHRDLDQTQRDAFRAQGRIPVLRLRTPDDGTVTFTDAVRGDITISWADVPDFVIRRADGSPTYYLANSVDDLSMGMTLVARGEDLLSATPRQLLLYECLQRDGLLDAALAAVGMPARPEDAVTPTFAHLPLLIGPDRKKLGKRHGSVAVHEFREAGFLPEVMDNFLALCGWSYDASTEHFTVAELIDKFSFERVVSNPAVFDTVKLRSFNGAAIKALNDEALATRLVPYLVAAGVLGDPLTPAQDTLLRGLVPLVKERIQTLAEAPPLMAFAFRDTVEFDQRDVAKHLKGVAGDVLDQAAVALEGVEDWNADTIMAALDGVSQALELGRGKTFQPVRVAVAGCAVSPPLPQTLAVMDRAVVVERVRGARQKVTPVES